MLPAPGGRTKDFCKKGQGVMNPRRFQLHIGQRNIKTAMSATLCALLYSLVDRNPTFACIGAIFGVGSDMENSRLNGGNRFFGTVIGGLLGMLLFRLYICIAPDGSHHFIVYLLLFVGVVTLILISRLVNWPGAVQPGGVVLCIILFNTPVDTYVSYSIHRMIDTGIGVAVALLINWLLPRSRMMWFEHMQKRGVLPETQILPGQETVDVQHCETGREKAV